MINPYSVLKKMDLSDIVDASGYETGIEPMSSDIEPEREEVVGKREYEEHYSDMRISCMAQILCLYSQKRLARSKAKKERLGTEIANLWELHKATYNPDFQDANAEGVNKY
jgi:hypothetical protein